MEPHQHSVDESTRLMQEGIAFLESGTIPPAVENFTQAIGIREKLPWREDWRFGWLLAAAWINYGDAVLQTEDEMRLPKAVSSYRKVIEAMRNVPMRENPAHPERLMLAWVNLGSCLGEGGDLDGACEAFFCAEKLLDEWGRGVSASRSFLEAMLLVNRARLLVGNHRLHDAWKDTRRAASILSPLGLPSALIKTWSIQCRILATMLDDPAAEDMPDDWIAVATDAVEGALELVKKTGYHDVWVSDLVRYGAMVYRQCQPHFLGEFLRDWLETGPLSRDESLKKEMGHELLLAQAELEQRVIASSQDTEYVKRQIVVLQSLQRAAETLNPC